MGPKHKKPAGVLSKATVAGQQAKEPPRKKVKTLDNTVASDEEHELEFLLFGDTLPVKQPLGERARQKEREQKVKEAAAEGDDAPAFYIDKGSKSSDSEGEEEEIQEPAGEQGQRPAWEDDDDQALTVSVAGEKRLRKLRHTEEEDVVSGADYVERLRAQFTATYSTHQKWAQRHDDTDGDVLQWSGRLLQADRRLAQGTLNVTRVKDANVQDYSQAAVQCVQFHPRAQVLMTAGLDKTIRLFQVDGRDNSKVQSVHIKDLPIQSAAFGADGGHIYAAGRRHFFYVYDMAKGAVEKVHYLQGREEKSLESMYVSPSGKHLVFLGQTGSLLLVDTHTRRLVDTMKMNGTSRAVAFNEDGSRMFSHGGDGQVYVWDMNSRQCVHRFVDDGCLQGTCVSVAPGNRYLATGSDAGVVNIYDMATCMANSAPQPIRAVMNLTTRVDGLRFNHDAQILATYSRMKRDALKMVHLPSCTVFSNWPTATTPTRYAHCVDFSPQSGYLSVGNDLGKALLYRLTHYAQS